MTRLLLVRHGESEWNAEGRWQGHADPPLSHFGRRQAEDAAASVAGVDVVASSDLQRARLTATILAERCDLPLLDPDPDLRERAAGPWEGLTRAEIERGWPGWLADDRRPEGFEVDEHLLTRTTEALHRLAASRPSVSVLVVTHGGVIRAHERLHGAPPERVPNLGGRWLEVSGGETLMGERIELAPADERTLPPEH
jgi:probable phosphoglycerate mutase